MQIVSTCQAAHWFDLPAFYKETDRVLCPNGILAVLGYTFPQFIHPTKADDLHKAFDVVLIHYEFLVYGYHTVYFIVRSSIEQFYKERTGPYWGPGRQLVDNEYRDIILPYAEAKR